MTTTTKTAIAIDLDQLGLLAKEYISEMGGDGNNDICERLTLSSFIVWLRLRVQTMDNILTFKIEKGAGNGISGE